MRPSRFFAGVALAVALGIVAAPVLRAALVGAVHLAAFGVAPILTSGLGWAILVGVLVVAALATGETLLTAIATSIELRFGTQLVPMRRRIDTLGVAFDRKVRSRAPRWLWKPWAVPAIVLGLIVGGVGVAFLAAWLSGAA